VSKPRIRSANLNSPELHGSSQPGHVSPQIRGAASRSGVGGETSNEVQAPEVWREVGLGFGWWLAFLLLLEPGNLAAVARGGIPLAWTDEVLRIGGAALLGAVTTPLLFGLTRRLPVEGPRWRRRMGIHALSIVGLALILIVAAQVLAAWLLSGRDARLQAPLIEELARNGALLVLSMTAFVALVHAVRFLRHAEAAREKLADAAQPSPAGRLVRVPVKTRAGVLLLPLDEVDWIETQGNYLALHAGSKVHLVRDTLARFEGALDGRRFVRIHRRTIVRAELVREITPLSNGDASLRLIDGTDLRLSRGYAAAARSAFAVSFAAE